MEFKKYKLGDCFRMAENGLVIKQTKAAKGMPITRIETLSNDCFNRDRLGYGDIFDEEKYSHYILDDKDLLMSHINSRTFLGRTVLYRKRNGEKIIHGMNVLRIKTNQDILDPIFASYLFRTSLFKRHIDNIRKDAINQSSFALSDLKNIELYIPTVKEQNKIAYTLQLLDSKIALNRQINDNLEAMAKQLYDYWFVQFDFPNEEGKPYKSSGGAMVWNEKLKREIPTSFDVKSLSEIIEVKDGTHDSPKPQDNGYFLLTSKHLTERGLDYASAYKISKEDYESINKRSKVDTNDILFSMIGTIGNSYFVEETNINFAIKNMALFKTSAKRWFSEYLYLYLSSCDYKHYKGNSLSGSIQKFVSLRTLRDMPILYHEDIIKVFAKEVRNIITMMVNLRKENIELTKQRDELLPLLMNGQASVNYHLFDD